MRKPILIAAMIAAFATPAFAGELTLEDVRAMSDNELYALADTLSSEDETRLYQQARKEFPDGALGLQSAKDELQKRTHELAECEASIERGKASDLRSLNENEPGRYFSLLRIVSLPTDEVMDMTSEERSAEAPKVGRQTNRVIRQIRDCKRAYQKSFGDG